MTGSTEGNGSVLPYMLGQQAGGSGGGAAMWNNPLAWLIALGFLGKNGGGFFGGGGNDVVATSTIDAIRDIQSGVSASAVANANQTATLAETMNRIAADQAACCCSTKVEMANQGASIRESVLGQTNALQLGFMGAQNSALQNFASLQLQACQNTDSLRSQLAACCCETQKELLRVQSQLESGTDRILNETSKQTALLTLQATTNTQTILDRINAVETARLTDELSQARRDLSNCNQNAVLTNMMASQTAALMAAINNACGEKKS